MKILLLTVPPGERITADMSDIFDDVVGLYQPLGLVYLYSSLKQERPHDDVLIIDSPAEGLDEKSLIQRVLDFKPDIIGVTVLTFLVVEIYKCVAVLKEQYQDGVVVFGGPHGHLYPEEVLRNPNIDYVMTGEGERMFPQLVGCLEQGEEPSDVPGIFYRGTDGEIQRGPEPEPLWELDDLPLPDFSALPLHKYLSVVDSEPTAMLITSRGCPYHCIYCDRPIMGNCYREHSPERVLEEIQNLLTLDMHNFQIFDDTFTINGKRVIEICRLITQKNLEITFSARSRVNTVNEEVLVALKKAGCRRLSFGVEAASNQALEALKKGATVEQVITAFDISKKVGIDTLADFIIGGPGQTKTDIEDTIRFALQLNPTYVQFTVMTPYPGTELYRMGLEQGIIQSDYWQEFARNPTEGFETPVWEEFVSREELLDLFSKAYKRFYHRPSYILKEFLKVRSFGDLYGKVKIGLKMFST